MWKRTNLITRIEQTANYFLHPAGLAVHRYAARAITRLSTEVGSEPESLRPVGGLINFDAAKVERAGNCLVSNVHDRNC